MQVGCVFGLLQRIHCADLLVRAEPLAAPTAGAHSLRNTFTQFEHRGAMLHRRSPSGALQSFVS
jgi:hypothetical protein